MVMKEDKERLHHLLSDAIPLLCKSGLPFKSTFCIEALIGITMADDEVLLISFKEKIGNNALPFCVENGKEKSDETTGNDFGLTEVEFRDDDRFVSFQRPSQNKSRGCRKSSRNANQKGVTIDDVDIEVGQRPIKVEVDDVKMDDDEANSSSLATGGMSDVNRLAESMSEWNSFKQIPSSSFVVNDVPRRAKTENAVEMRCAKPCQRQSRVARTLTSPSRDHQEAYAETEMAASGREETVSRRKDRQNATFTHATFDPTAATLVDDPCLEGQTFDFASASVDQISAGSDIQFSDDRISLEQTRKILSSHRFSSCDDNVYSCHICAAKLRGRQTLNEHIRGMHFCARIYGCSNCGQSFKWRSGLQRHRSKCNVAPPGD